MKHIRIVLLFALSVSCTPNDVFHKKSRGKWITKKSYDLGDTIIVNNFGLYNTRNEVLLIANKEPFPVNKDSLLAIFQKSLSTLGLSRLEISFKDNLIDSSLFRQYAIRMKHLEDSYVSSFVKFSKHNTVLVPLIYADNQYQFTGYFTSGGAFGSSGWNAITWLHLFVFIFQNEEIIYSRHIRYKSDVVWADTEEEILAVPPLAAVRQEHWDELVRLAMKDYIKRVK
ncbi:hypothetical protein MMU07_04575 [Aquiflexum sp. LQ15W]|nr:hypothetical protein [Cognataquiflexum nitidum]